MRVTGLAILYAYAYVLSVKSGHGRTEQQAMTNVEILDAATDRHERAQERVELARVRLDHLAPNTPLRYGVAATRRFREALAEAQETERAYEAAQDLPAPEDWD